MPSNPARSKSTGRAVHSIGTYIFPKPSNDHARFLCLLEYLRQPLQPLVSCTSGPAHADFPPNVLAYYLLTSNQLNDLALHFHQVWPPISETFNYPIQVPTWVGTGDEEQEALKSRRSRFGKFIGLSPEFLLGDDLAMGCKVQQLLTDFENDYDKLRQQGENPRYCGDSNGSNRKW